MPVLYATHVFIESSTLLQLLIWPIRKFYLFIAPGGSQVTTSWALRIIALLGATAQFYNMNIACTQDQKLLTGIETFKNVLLY